MTRFTIPTIALAALMALSHSGCSKGPDLSGKTPEQVYRLYVETMAKQDGPAVWAMMTNSMQEEIVPQMQRGIAKMPDKVFEKRFGADKAALDGLEGEAFFVKFMKVVAMEEKTLPGLDDIEVEENEDGDVVIHSVRGEARCSTPMAKEDGVWKIDGGGRCKVKVYKDEELDPEPSGAGPSPPESGMDGEPDQAKQTVREVKVPVPPTPGKSTAVATRQEKTDEFELGEETGDYELGDGAEDEFELGDEDMDELEELDDEEDPSPNLTR